MRTHFAQANAVASHGKGAQAFFAALCMSVSTSRHKRALALSAALCMSLSTSQVIAAPASHTIVIEAMQFSPQVLEVKAGDTIEWINKDAFPHNATTVAKGFKSKPLPPNAHWKFTAREKGSFAYTCTLHPMMTARLIVK